MDIVKKVRSWVKKNYRTDNHLIRAEYWLKKLYSGADEAMIVAAIAHDIERAFLKNRKPRLESVSWDNKKYNLRHGKRSARFVVDFLRKQGQKPKFISRVKHLITYHELGGDEERNLIKDADSLSFFENNIPLFLFRTKELNKFTRKKWTKDDLREKFDYMFNRISSVKARKLALLFYKKALRDLEKI